MDYHNDIRDRIDPHLVKVSRPARYVGGELNMIRNEPDARSIKVCLAFPDIYDIGQSYIGFYILYNILNKRRATLCERTFAPWTDMEEIMRRESIPLWSLESFHPVSSFDVIGFTLQYELHYTTVLNMLDLAGIPLKSCERSDSDPIIFGGGPNCINPEPVAEFFDAFLLGDGEEAFPEILDVIESSRLEGLSKEKILTKLAGVDGVYIPSLYTPRTDDGRFGGMTAVEGAPLPVKARIVERLKPEYYPERPLVPNCEIVHDRLAVELMRGCSRGCRFCNAGMTYRPKRERPVDEVVDQIVKNIDATGWEEISLVSLSTSDYTGIDELVPRIGEALGDKTVSVSLSSLRADNFSVSMANAVAGGRKTSLTFAPEAGSQRLRNVINKNLTEEQLFETLTTALSGGWKSFKLYFMIGLPTETDEDITAIADLLNKVHGLMKRFNGRRANVTVSTFSPKPMTPFQREPQISVDEIDRRVKLLKRNLRSRSINIKSDNPLISMLECRLGRGGREMSALIMDAWQRGCRLDGWSEHFNAAIWREVFKQVGIDLTDGNDLIDPDVQLPWSHLSYGVSDSFLLGEREKAILGECTPDCGEECSGCGPYAPFCAALKQAQSLDTTTMDKKMQAEPGKRIFGRKPRTASQKNTNLFLSDTRFRIKFAKRNTVRYMSHLDFVRMFDRAMRRAGIPVAYSQGFHPHPKISFGLPLPLGMLSFAEYADFSLKTPFPSIENVLGKELRGGFDIIGIRSISQQAESLNSLVSLSEYHVPAQLDKRLETEVNHVLDSSEIIVERTTKKGIKSVDIRPGIIGIETTADKSGLTMLLSTAPGKSVKPVEVLTLLFGKDNIPDGVTRLEQYTEVDGQRITPLEVIH
ncbi:TIGR03960 family B12-binding radical SAM protein [Candidatus Latescibacterota bacterium]